MASMILPLATSLIGLGGGLLGKPKPTTSTTHSTQTSEGYTRPDYDPKTQALRDMMINAYMSQIEDNGDYFDGYKREGLANIGAGAQSSQRQISNMLANRGIQGPMAGAGLSAPIIAQQGQTSSFLNSIPQLQDQRRMGMLQAGSGFLSSLPIAQRTSGSQTGDSKTTQSGGGVNAAGSAIANMGTFLGGLYGSGAFGKQPNSGGGIDPGTYGGGGYDYGNVNTPGVPVAPPSMPQAPQNNPWTYNPYPQGF